MDKVNVVFDQVCGFVSKLSTLLLAVLSLAVIAQGTANLIMIEKGMSQMASAAVGADFITSGPQMLMVGDNPTGKERVQVTPIGSPNINGPQSGISVNINGPITNDDYVRDFIIPEIQKATRLDLA